MSIASNQSAVNQTVNFWDKTTDIANGGLIATSENFADGSIPNNAELDLQTTDFVAPFSGSIFIIATGSFEAGSTVSATVNCSIKLYDINSGTTCLGKTTVKANDTENTTAILYRANIVGGLRQYFKLSVDTDYNAIGITYRNLSWAVYICPNQL
jgi:hypothetical protein